MSDNEIYKQYYGKKFDKAMKNARLPVKRARLEFKKQYPNANIKKFTFDAEVSKDGDVTNTSITYIFNEEEGYDITSETFKTQYADMLYWSPRIWDPSGTV